MSENTVSKSKAKRQARRAENERLKREAKRNKFIGITVVVLICAAFLGGIGSFVYYNLTTTVASSDYQAGLNDDGTIKDVIPTEHIEPLDYKNIPVTVADIEYTEENINNDIDTALNNNKVLSTDSSFTAADGDTLNIDYVGTIDGTEFEGGNTNGAGADLTLGSDSYIDGFEDQLIGSHPGDTVTVNVTFPEDYSTTDLQGKDAVFEVVVNGIYELPQLTDEFIATNFSEYASTVEEYKTYLKTYNEDLNLKNYLSNYIREHAVATSYNQSHVKYLKSIEKYEQESYYTSLNQMYISYLGSPAYSSFEEFSGMSSKEFEAHLDEEAHIRAAADMTYQYIFADAGLSISEEDYETQKTSLGTSADSYGKGYIMQMLMQDKVIEYLAETVTVQ